MGQRGAFIWDERPVARLLEDVRFLQGLLFGRLAAAPIEALAGLAEKALADEIVASAAIEGTELDARLVATLLEARTHGAEASNPADERGVGRRDGAGLEHTAEKGAGRDAVELAQPSRVSKERTGADGACSETELAQTADAVAVALDATADCFGAATLRRAAEWHEVLFASGHAGSRRVEPGRYRTERFGEEPSERVMEEMDACLAAIDRATADEASADLMLIGALAHLSVFLIRPFATGNGRIVRTLTELVLMRVDALAAVEAESAMRAAIAGSPTTSPPRAIGSSRLIAGAPKAAAPSPLLDSLASLREGRLASDELPLRLYGLSPFILENLSAYKAEIVKARDWMKEAAAVAAEAQAPIACDVTDWVVWYLTALKASLAEALARIPDLSLSQGADAQPAARAQGTLAEDASAPSQAARVQAERAPVATSVPNAPSTVLDSAEKGSRRTAGSSSHSTDGPSLTPRQRDALERIAAAILAEGPQANRISTGAWAQLCEVSTDTALRDITDLVRKGILIKDDKRGGRSTSYRLVEAWLSDRT